MASKRPLSNSPPSAGPSAGEGGETATAEWQTAQKRSKRPRAETPKGKNPETPSTAIRNFKVVAETSAQGYSIVKTLEAKKDLKILAKPNHMGQWILRPQDITSYHILKASDLNLLELNPEEKTLKACIVGYPLTMEMSHLTKLPQILSAERQQSKAGHPTKTVVCNFKGPIPQQINLGMWGRFKVTTYHKEPLRCFNCQRFGHHKNQCTATTICAICSQRHNTDLCLSKLKAGDADKPKARCPNCKQQHHAWNRRCPARLQKIQASLPKAQNAPRAQTPATPKPQRAPRKTHSWQTQKPAEAQATAQILPISKAPNKKVAAEKPAVKTKSKASKKGKKTNPQSRTAASSKTGKQTSTISSPSTSKKGMKTHPQPREVAAPTTESPISSAQVEAAPTTESPISSAQVEAIPAAIKIKFRNLADPSTPRRSSLPSTRPPTPWKLPSPIREGNQKTHRLPPQPLDTVTVNLTTYRLSLMRFALCITQLTGTQPPQEELNKAIDALIDSLRPDQSPIRTTPVQEEAFFSPLMLLSPLHPTPPRMNRRRLMEDPLQLDSLEEYPDLNPRDPRSNRTTRISL